MRELEATELRMRETEEEVRETERAAHEVSPGASAAKSGLIFRDGIPLWHGA
jgi:hypothetical protein